MRTVWRIIKILLVVIVLLVIGWLGFTRLNLGRLLQWARERRPRAIEPGKVVGANGEVIGNEVGITRDTNPLRDKSVLKTDDGQEIQLPHGVQDSDVIKVVRVQETEAYDIKIEHDRLTDVFGRGGGDGSDSR